LSCHCKERLLQTLPAWNCKTDVFGTNNSNRYYSMCRSSRKYRKKESFYLLPIVDYPGARASTAERRLTTLHVAPPSSSTDLEKRQKRWQWSFTSKSVRQKFEWVARYFSGKKSPSAFRNKNRSNNKRSHEIETIKSRFETISLYWRKSYFETEIEIPSWREVKTCELCSTLEKTSPSVRSPCGPCCSSIDGCLSRHFTRDCIRFVPTGPPQDLEPTKMGEGRPVTMKLTGNASPNIMTLCERESRCLWFGTGWSAYIQVWHHKLDITC